MFMPTATVEPGSSLLAGYRLPQAGVLRTVPVHSLPPEAVRVGHNVWLHQGALRARPGMVADASAASYGAVANGAALGSFLYVSKSNVKMPVVATESAIAQLEADGIWRSLATITATRAQPVRFTALENNQQVSLLAASADIGLLHKTESAAGFTAITLPEGLAASRIVDIATAATRIVLAQPPYTIAWSNSLQPTVYQDTSQLILADTEDRLVAIKQLGTLGFVIYKEGSIYLGIAQSGADAFAFKPEFYGEAEGPCGPQAIVSINNVHYYMTPSGRVGIFTGTQQAFIADGLWPFLQDDLDRQYIKHVNACFDYQLNTVFFFYPRKGDNGACHGLVTLNLPYPTAGIAQHASFTGLTHLDITNALSVRLFDATQKPFLFATDLAPTTQKVLRLDKEVLTDDNGLFDCVVQPGLTPSPQAMIYKPYIELQAHRGEDHGVVNIYQVTSNLLETADGTVEDKETLLDLTIVTPAQYLGFTTAATFLGFRLEWLSDQNLIYYGCDMYGRPTA